MYCLFAHSAQRNRRGAEQVERRLSGPRKLSVRFRYVSYIYIYIYILFVLCLLYMYVYVYTYVYIYIYIHIGIIHMYIYIYIHIHRDYIYVYLSVGRVSDNVSETFPLFTFPTTFPKRLRRSCPTFPTTFLTTFPLRFRCAGVCSTETIQKLTQRHGCHIIV